MKLGILLFCSVFFTTGDALKSYKIPLDVELDTSEAGIEGCSHRDLGVIEEAALMAFIAFGNDYLDKHNFPGEVSIDHDEGRNRRLSSVKKKDDNANSDPMMESNHRELLNGKFKFGYGGRCRFCPDDDNDGHRGLRGQDGDTFSIDKMLQWTTARSHATLMANIDLGTSEACQRTAKEWYAMYSNEVGE